MNRLLNQAATGRENNFDFIRFLAALLVIFSHAFPLTNSGEDPLISLSNNNLSFGGLSVSIFFIISGFLITSSYDRSKNLYSYFTSRALRIYPALIAVIVTSALILGPLLTANSLKSYFSNSKTYKYFTNILALRIQHSLPGVFENNYFPDFINGSLWSLPNEILCYCLVALVGLLIARKFKPFIVLLCILTVYIYFHTYLYFQAQYYYNIFYFACGASCYLLREKIRLNYTTAIIMISIFIVGTRYTHDLVFALIMGISLTYLIMFLAFLRNNHVQYFSKYGDFSYGLYIWAFPVQQTLVHQFKHIGAYSNFFISSVISLILAILSWHLIEKRALKLKKATAIRKKPAIHVVKEEEMEVEVI